LIEFGANAAKGYGAAAEAISALRQLEMDAAPWYGKIGPWIAKGWWAGKAAVWGSVATGLERMSRFLAGLSVGVGACAI
jgi:hypothetical protein